MKTQGGSLSWFLKEIVSPMMDIAFALMPRRRPSESQLKLVKMVGHRGGIRPGVKENTLEAFDICAKNSVWGIEFDIRWTKDNQPIVLHDEDAGRVFGKPNIKPKNLLFSELKEVIPAIPHLKEVVRAYSKVFHFMIELKDELSPERETQLVQCLKGMEVIKDFHILSLDPEKIVSLEKYYPKESFVGISTSNTKFIYHKVLELSFGGHAGHFLLLNKKIQKIHQKRGQKVAVGFADSKNSFYREADRGLDWIFSNRPEEIMHLIKT